MAPEGTPSDKLWGKQTADSLGKGVMSSARALPQALHDAAVGCRCQWDGDLGTNCRVERPGETMCLQHQQDITLHTCPSSPSRPHWPLSILVKPNVALVILRPLKNGSVGEEECVLGTTPKCCSIQDCGGGCRMVLVCQPWSLAAPAASRLTQVDLSEGAGANMSQLL